ncbi:hypothetical protein GCM10009863_64100 [Streptomyces axinellae]|uniref:Uncharacterized protein n=1 Tax=Streptomyces axinellae TaxID=552788 RepID=A0ABN3QYA6_9ACTN
MRSPSGLRSEAGRIRIRPAHAASALAELFLPHVYLPFLSATPTDVVTGLPAANQTITFTAGHFSRGLWAGQPWPPRQARNVAAGHVREGVGVARWASHVAEGNGGGLCHVRRSPENCEKGARDAARVTTRSAYQVNRYSFPCFHGVFGD